MPFGHARGCNFPSPSPHDLIQETNEQWRVRGIVHEHRLRVSAESVEHWRTWARAFDGMIRLSAACAQNFVGEMKDWDAIHAAIAPDFPGSKSPREEFDELRAMVAKWSHAKRDGVLIELARLKLISTVGRIIQVAGIAPRFEWNGARTRFG